jgi:hypothetical protein
MRYVPLLLVPFLLYNAFAFLIFGDYDADFREAHLLSVTIPSGATFTLSVATTIVLLALVLLGVELVKAARAHTTSLIEHALAAALFVVFLGEFLIVRQAATGTFLMLTVIALVDLVCGFALTLRAAARDIPPEG